MKPTLHPNSTAVRQLTLSKAECLLLLSICNHFRAKLCRFAPADRKAIDRNLCPYNDEQVVEFMHDLVVQTAESRAVFTEAVYLGILERDLYCLMRLRSEYELHLVHQCQKWSDRPKRQEQFVAEFVTLSDIVEKIYC